MGQELTIIAGQEVVPVNQIREQVNFIQNLMKEVMKENEHYGVIPGTNGKPSLLKAGAEKLGFMFRLAASYEITEKAHDMGHVEFIVRCKITHIESGRYLGEGVGSASTLESKYRYRKAAKACPSLTCASLRLQSLMIATIVRDVTGTRFTCSTSHA